MFEETSFRDNDSRRKYVTANAVVVTAETSFGFHLNFRAYLKQFRFDFDGNLDSFDPLGHIKAYAGLILDIRTFY
jgi:hypothetical protein